MPNTLCINLKERIYIKKIDNKSDLRIEDEEAKVGKSDSKANRSNSRADEDISKVGSEKTNSEVKQKALEKNKD